MSPKGRIHVAEYMYPERVERYFTVCMLTKLPKPIFYFAGDPIKINECGLRWGDISI